LAFGHTRNVIHMTDNLIPVSQLPKRKNWQQIFESVPEGFAKEIDEDYQPVYAALSALKKKSKEFRNYRIIGRDHKVYIAHDKEVDDIEAH
jgi:hypothetical protein